MRNTIAKITDFFDYVFDYKVNREQSEQDRQYDMRVVEATQLKKRLSTFSIALKRSERIRVKYNEAIIENTKLKRENELLEISRNRYMDTCKKRTNENKKLKQKVEELEQKLGATL